MGPRESLGRLQASKLPQSEIPEVGFRGLDSSGGHSGQGSFIPGITKEIGLSKNISGLLDRLLAQNFDAGLAGIVI